MIEMDSPVAVKLIQAKEVDRSIYVSLIKEIRYLLSLRESCITHINRSQNKVSDSLAKFAHLEGRTMSWIWGVDSLPCCGEGTGDFATGSRMEG